MLSGVGRRVRVVNAMTMLPQHPSDCLRRTIAREEQASSSRHPQYSLRNVFRVESGRESLDRPDRCTNVRGWLNKYQANKPAGTDSSVGEAQEVVVAGHGDPVQFDRLLQLRFVGFPKKAHFANRHDIDASTHESSNDPSVDTLINVQAQRHAAPRWQLRSRVSVDGLELIDQLLCLPPLFPDHLGVIVEVRKRCMHVCERQVGMRLHDLVRRHATTLELVRDLADLDSRSRDHGPCSRRVDADRYGCSGHSCHGTTQMRELPETAPVLPSTCGDALVNARAWPNPGTPTGSLQLRFDVLAIERRRLDTDTVRVHCLPDGGSLAAPRPTAALGRGPIEDGSRVAKAMTSQSQTVAAPRLLPTASMRWRSRHSKSHATPSGESISLGSRDGTITSRPAIIGAEP